MTVRDRAEIVQERLGGRLSVPTLPRILKRLRELLADADVSMAEVGAVIAQDPPLTARLLRLVNSAYYALQVPVLSTDQACSMLGLRGLSNLLLRAPVFSQLVPAGFDFRGMWRHSILAARLCEQMQPELPSLAGLAPSELYVHGLLADIGQFVMFEGLGEDYVAVRNAEQAGERSLDDLEREALGFSHNELGAMLLKRWSFPDVIVRAARFHHNEGGVAETDAALAAVFVACAIAEHAWHGKSMSLDALVPERIADRLGLESDCFSRLVELAKSSKDDLGV